MTQTITTEELLALTKSADLLRQTAEQALRCDSLARELHNAKTDRDHLAGILEKIMQIFEGHPDLGPQDFAELPLEVSTLHEMYNEELAKNDRLLRENESLKGEVVTAGNHAACRLNVLKDIHRILGTDGLPNGANALTGVSPQLARLPKRIEQLLADVTTWRERYDMMIAENGELVRENAAVKDAHHAMWKRLQLVEGENETLARNMPPEPPADAVPALMPDQFNASQPTGFTKNLGQQWCRVNHEDDVSKDTIGLRYTSGGWICLCNVYQDVQTGALTYRPLAAKDLPVIP